MKETLTSYEVSILEPLLLAADGLNEAFSALRPGTEVTDAIRDAQRGLIDSIERVLLIESWDMDKRDAVEAHIHAGGLGTIEKFLADLGVGIHDPLATDD
jgi:hypothetical protein